MTNFYLAMYNFKIKINKGSYLELNKIPVEKEYRKTENSKYLTFRDICEIIFEENKFLSEDLKVCAVKKSEEPFFHAQLGLAEYGNKRGLHDAKNDVSLPPLESTDKVLEPFFFMFCTPFENNNINGFLVIEKKKSKPIIDRFNKMIVDKLKEINPQLRMIPIPHNPKELEDVVTDGVVKEYVFTIYENESDEFNEKTLTKIKVNAPVIEKISPIEVDKNKVFDKFKKVINFLNDTKFQMKVSHSDNQEVTLDIDDMINHKVFHLKINDEISTVNDNPTYESMIKVGEKYTESNFDYYVRDSGESRLSE